MQDTFTSEDIIVLVVMISILYGLMDFFQRRLKNYLHQYRELTKWGMSLKLNDNQKKILMDLWCCYKKNILPQNNIEQLLSDTELKELLFYSEKESLPQELKSFFSQSKYDKTFNNLIKTGFSELQAKILYGILYNKIGGIHAIKF
ncbi:MAG: hypothetical protein AB7V50_07390 [Vampirovibrionia bacterium]